MAGLGCGDWRAAIAARGGSPVSYEVPFTGLSMSKVLNSSGQARVSMGTSADARSACCEIFNEVEPWKDELLLYRDRELVYVGPITTLTSGGEISSTDLFTWMDLRFLDEDFHGDADVADIFHMLFDSSYAKDTSINLDISTRPTGVHAVRDFKGDQFQPVGNLMRELARTGLDYTMDNRRILAGGLEVFLSTTPLKLHDGGCVSAEVVKEGQSFATDVAVFGSAGQVGAPVHGRAIRQTDRYGLIQRSFTELLIKDDESADANALARLESMQPAPIRFKAQLSADAPFSFVELVPGRRMEPRLREAAGCVEVNDVLRLQQVDASVSVSEAGETEEVSIDAVPLGVTE